METENAVEALAALAQATRLELFRHLVQLGPAGACPGELGEAFGIAPATLSFHLSALRHAGLVRQHAAGRKRIYVARFDTMHGLVDYLTENCCGGADCRTAESEPARAGSDA